MTKTSLDLTSKQEQVLLDEILHASEKIQSCFEALKTVIIGQEEVLKLTLITLLSGGHALLTGAPGLAKTRLVHHTAQTMGLKNGRIQFTPDLMPYDITGSEVLEEDQQKKRIFRFIQGPVFCQLLMADEINRASPRTQSALLQAMQEYEVTISGVHHKLPTPFHVLATQNPIEQEGTYPLPEAQLDRFLYQINLSYPNLESEKEVLIKTTHSDEMKVKKQLSFKQLIEFQTLVRRLPIGEGVVNAILFLIRELRPETSHLDLVKQSVLWGPGSRAGQALMLGTRALSLFEGRLSPNINDIKRLAKPALRHRIILNYSANKSVSGIDELIDHVLKRLDEI